MIGTALRSGWLQAQWFPLVSHLHGRMSLMVPNATLLLTNRISATGIRSSSGKGLLEGRRSDRCQRATGIARKRNLRSPIEDRELGERVARLLDAGTALSCCARRIRARKESPWSPTAMTTTPDVSASVSAMRHPPLVYAAGPLERLDVALLGVVRSRNVDEQGAAGARSAAGAAQRVGAGIVSGGARGVDLISMDAAYELGVPSVEGVTAEA